MVSNKYFFPHFLFFFFNLSLVARTCYTYRYVKYWWNCWNPIETLNFISLVEFHVIYRLSFLELRHVKSFSPALYLGRLLSPFLFAVIYSSNIIKWEGAGPHAVGKKLGRKDASWSASLGRYKFVKTLRREVLSCLGPSPP